MLICKAPITCAVGFCTLTVAISVIDLKGVDVRWTDTFSL